MDAVNHARDGADPQPLEFNSSELNAPSAPVLLRGHTGSAYAFLRDVIREGRVAFGAIDPISGAFKGATADVVEEGERVLSGIEACQGKKNIYYRLNEPVERERQQGRSGAILRKDLARLRGAVVDIDPPKDVEAQPNGLVAWRETTRQRIEELADDPKGPSAIVDSGGGFQLIWVFQEFLPATEANIAAVEALSKALADLYGGDATHDAVHLFRVPFTVNLPDERKRSRGRKPALTCGWVLEPPRRHTLEGLLASTPAVDVEATSPAAPPFDMDLAWEACGRPEALPADLAERVAVARAKHPGLEKILNAEPPEAGSGKRSDHDFAIACACLKAGLSDRAEVAAVVVAYSPSKFEDEDDRRGRERAERYLSLTVDKACAKVARAGPARFFTPIDDPDDPDDAVAFEAPAPPRVPNFRVHTTAPDPRSIPLRRHVIYPRCLAGELLCTVAMPGASKSTLALHDGVVIASGEERILRGEDNVSPERLHRAGPVLIYDAEDPLAEMERRLSAMMRFHGLTTLRHPLALLSGAGSAPLWVARRNRETGALVEAEGAALLRKMILDLGAVYAVVGPFAGLAEGMNENDASEANFVMQILKNIAAATGACINVIHHTSKSGGTEAGDMNAVRGSSAIAAAARAVVTLNTMPEAEARRYGLTARNHVVLTYAKVSHGPRPDGGIILRRDSAPVCNGLGLDDPREAFELSAQDMLRAEGDHAPVLSVVALRAVELRLAVREEKRISVEDGTAAAVLAVLDGPGRQPLRDVLSDLTAALHERGVLRGSAQNTVREHLRSHLAGSGRLATHAGQNVRVRLVKDGPKLTDPWFVLVETTSEQTERQP